MWIDLSFLLECRLVTVGEIELDVVVRKLPASQVVLWMDSRTAISKIRLFSIEPRAGLGLYVHSLLSGKFSTASVGASRSDPFSTLQALVKEERLARPADQMLVHVFLFQRPPFSP